MKPEKDQGILGKPLMPNAGIGAKYSAAVRLLLRQMAQETHRELARMFHAPGYALDDRLSAVDDGSPSARARIIINRLRQKYGPRFGRLAKMATRRMIRSTIQHVDRSAGLSLKEMSASFKLPGFWSNRLRDIVEASTQEATSLIGTIPDRFLNQVQGAAMRSIVSGKGLADFTPQLQKFYGEDRRKAHLVALDQTRKVYNSLAAQRMQDAGVKQFIWRHSHGGNEPRKQHLEWDGQVFRYDDPPVDDRFGPVLPGWAINCVPGGSQIENADGLFKLFRRSYSGKLVTLVTESNETVKATPNHPILTAEGWKPIQSVDIGEYIVKTLNNGGHRIEADAQHSATEVGQLFSAADEVFSGKTAPVSGLFQFHGDVADSEVDVVAVDGFLPDEADVQACQFLLELVLSWAETSGPTCTLPAECASDQLILRVLQTPVSIVRRLGPVTALLRSHASGTDDVRLALSTYVDAGLQQALADGSTRNIEAFRHLQLAHPGDIGSNDICVRELFALASRAFAAREGETSSADELAEAVRVNAQLGRHIFECAARLYRLDRVRDHVVEELSSGHVYNLETNTGWYSTNGFIIHNCRCFQRPVLTLGAENA